MKRWIPHIVCIIIVSTFSCKGIYPITTRLESIKENINTDGYIKIDYVQNNMFQLRIQESVDFLDRKGKDDNDVIPSETPFRRFEQLLSQQEEYVEGDDLVIEETYLYLDNISKSGGASSGVAFYMITYPIVEREKLRMDKKSRTRTYYNNHTELFFNIVSSIQVGYWFKNNDDELLMIFKNKDEDTFVIKGHYENGHYIGLSKISHPSQLAQRRISSSQLYKDYYSFSSMKAKRNNATLNDSLTLLFNKLEKATPLIELKAVFELKPEEELIFYKLPQDKVVYKSIDFKQATNPNAILNNIFLGKVLNEQKLFFEFKRDTVRTLYRFNSKKVYFLE